MPGLTGHVLRNTYREVASSLGAPPETIRMLLNYRDQTSPRVRLTEYSGHLKATQQKISDHLDKLTSMT
ncbi:hypothetical protein COL8621_00642 [Actibacterium lipolyticum]|uniref:Uncharacterized protein n=2 Tax=Actibacterium lipolyticum TaxID=1524263 RepID=A0A238JQ57_9RHOB|nr:hypothetical protein COL8621_00642 [Actibacterium lipolyticum]